MAHIFFIDPLEKINMKKDSTLMMALSFQAKGHSCYLLFEDDFYITNQRENKLVLYRFEGEFLEDGCYIRSFKKTTTVQYHLTHQDYVHMRIDPPYDTRYQRYLWMLNFLEEQTKCKVVNNPLKIMRYNEKLIAYKNLEHSHLSYVGSSKKGFLAFKESLKMEGFSEIILKPLDLYSGIGVEKVDLNDQELESKFEKKVHEFHGAIVAQPFVRAIYKGEYRSIYFDGKELGTIIKRPNKGEYLANIAQGAKFEKAELPVKLKKICDELSQELFQNDVRLIAFDILGDGINEVNITCPGLLVEVSYAYEKNLCNLIADSF